MIADILVRYLHFISIIILMAAVLGQHLVLKPSVIRSEIKRAKKLNAAFAIMAILVIATGLLLWLGVGKPKDFYSSNPVFHIKFTLFIVVGILSIFPTKFLKKHLQGEANDLVEVPRGVIMILRVELLILFLMPLIATLIAKGIGIPAVSE